MPGKLRYAGIALVAVVSAWFFWATYQYTNGGLSMPLDDTFIYFTFARNIAEGHVMQWSPGGGFSSATTSPIYPFVLAIGYALGFKGEMLILWAFLLGVGCAIAAFFLVADLVRRAAGDQAGEWTPLFGGAMFALSGFLIWGYLSGMEIPLFSLAMLATLLNAHDRLSPDAAVRAKARVPLAVWGGLLSVMRPEGFILVALLVAFLSARSLLAGDRRAARGDLAWAALLAPGAIWMGITLALTGHFAGASAIQKSYFFEPSMTPYLFLDLTTKNIAKNATGLYSGYFFYDGSPLLLTPFFLVGLLPRMVREARERRLGFAWLGAIWFFLGGLPTMMSLASDDHHFRYQMPFYHLYLIWAVVGVADAARAIEGRFRLAAATAFSYFLIATFLSLPRWADTYGMNCKNIFDQQIRMAKVVDRFLPKDAIVGLNDAGAIPYFGNRRTFDVLGLATEGQNRWFRPGAGSLYEGFENLPPADRPRYFAIYPTWFFFEEIFTKKLAVIILEDNTICGGDEKVLYEADWSILGSGHHPQAPHSRVGSLMDVVDLADLDSEEQHDFHGAPTTVYGAYPYLLPGQEQPKTEEEYEKLKWGPKVADGGRPITYADTRQTMKVKLEGGKDVGIVGRVECKDLPGRLTFTIGGKRIGEWRVSPGMGFIEPESMLPGSYVKEGLNDFAIDYEGEGSVIVYNLWFYQ